MADTSLVLNILARDKTKATFDKMKGAAMAAGAAVGLAVAAGVGSAMAKSKLDATLAAQLGQSGPDVARLGKLSGQIYADNFGDSAEDVSAALKAAFQSGLIPKNAGEAEAKQLTERLMTVSQVMGEETGRVSSAVQQMMRTGMAGSAEEAFDIITRSTQLGINKSEDLLDTLNEYGTQFRKVGLDGETSMGLISQALKAGARDSDTVADALKEFSIRAIDGSKTTATGFKMLGLDATKMGAQIAKGGKSGSDGLQTVLERLRGIKDPVKQAQAATALFGTKAEDLGKSLFAMNLDTASKQMGNLAGATDQAAATMGGSAGAKFEALKRQIQGAFMDKINQAMPAIQGFFGFISNNMGVIMTLATVIGAVAVVMGVVRAATIAWSIAQTIASTASAIWTGIQWLLNIALTANPVGAIIMAIMVLIGIIILIATKTTWFQTAWKWAWGGIKAAAAAVGRWFSGTLWPLMKSVWNGIVSVFNSAKDRVVKVAVGIFNFWKSLPGKIKAAFLNVANIISSPFRAAFNAVARFWNSTVGRLSFRMPDWVPGMGGKGFSMPQLPMLAKGGVFQSSGLAIVGENGPEIISGNPGARVTPLPRGGMGGGETHIHIHGDLKGAIRKIVRIDGRGSVTKAFEKA